MRRLWHTWAALGLAFALALGGMVWVTVAALHLDRAEVNARRHAALEENVRLALWRMDSALTPLIARESGHPYFAYAAFYPVDRAYTRMFAELRHGEVLMPSPLLAQTPPRVFLYFQFGPKQRVTSPQVPAGNMRDLAEARGYTTQAAIEAGATRLARLTAMTSFKELASRLPRGQAQSGVAVRLEQMQQLEQSLANVQQNDQPQKQTAPVQQQRASNEARARSQRAAQAYLVNADAQSGSSPSAAQKAVAAPAKVIEGVMQPLWLDGALLLARRVDISGETYVQGCWLDWAGIRDDLLREVRELLPDARLEPVRAGNGSGTARMLATVPARLIADGLPRLPKRGWSPIHVAVAIAWACVLIATVAVGGLLVGAVRLSERRGDFVSAVTHELRTPLTTFRMYAEMLAEGMVPDEAKHTHYLHTLRGEADRLSHLVENVLAYARLERHRSPRQAEAVRVGDFFDRVAVRLSDRVARAGRELVASDGDGVADVAVRADVSVVEQILLNLVDNACKYGTSPSDPRIHLDARRTDGTVELRVRDHGPGVQPEEVAKLFRPFSKSAREAAHSAPGIGLGLALSRRLARDLGGNLRLDTDVSDGACFVLELPSESA